MGQSIKQIVLSHYLDLADIAKENSVMEIIMKKIDFAIQDKGGVDLQWETVDLQWEYEDMLPEELNGHYDLMFRQSKIIEGARMFPYININDKKYFLQ